MKDKIHYLIEGALGIAVIVLFALFFSGNKKVVFSENNSLDTGSYAGSPLPIAYIDVDSLLLKYQYSIDLQEQITRKYENMHANLTVKLRNFQSEIADFQRKADTGSFASMERAKSEEQRLTKKRDDLQQFEASQTKELQEEAERLNEEMHKTIISQLKDFNQAKGFHVIFGKLGDNIFYADKVYNITNEVVEFLNKNYTSPQKDTSAKTTDTPAE
jgi:outer membrane protein